MGTSPRRPTAVISPSRTRTTPSAITGASGAACTRPPTSAIVRGAGALAAPGRVPQLATSRPAATTSTPIDHLIPDVIVGLPRASRRMLSPGARLFRQQAVRAPDHQHDQHHAHQDLL